MAYDTLILEVDGAELKNLERIWAKRPQIKPKI